MQRHLLTLFAAAVVGLTATQASATDLPRRAAPAPAYVPPAPAPLPYLWTGCYIGGNLGWAQGNLEVTNTFTGTSVSRDESGFAGGGQIGCDYQFAGRWVVGIRNMFDGTSISHTRDFFDPFAPGFGGTGSIETRLRWFDTLTGRVGYLGLPNLLFYVQGGAAWTNASVTIRDAFGNEFATNRSSRTGWTVGAGVEWMFVPHWSVFLEANWLDFGRDSGFTCGPNFCGNNVFNARADIRNVLVGVNWKW